ncbi:MAG: Sec-independent protein translocase subunit TatA/TatB [Acidobacteriaceae bacterium]
MSFADPIVIFLLALILFGPKKLPEIGRQIGKLMAEFRRASNEFKFQIDEELRNMEQQERQKKLEVTTAAESPALAAPQQSEESPSYDGELNEIDERASRHAYLEGDSYEEDENAEEPTEPVILPPSTGETVSTERPFIPVASPELLEAAEANPHPVYAEALAAEQNGSSNHIGPEPESAQAIVNHG